MASSSDWTILVSTDRALERRVSPPGRPDSVLVPSPKVPTGYVWPAVDGRIALEEAATGSSVATESEAGDWTVQAGSSWKLWSAAGQVFQDGPEARAALAEWARLHEALQSHLHTGRALAVGPAGDGTWRLWQLVRGELSLRDRAESSAGEGRPGDLGSWLFLGADALLKAVLEHPRLRLHTPPRLAALSLREGRPIYLGFLPPPQRSVDSRLPVWDSEAILRREVGDLLKSCETSAWVDIAKLVERLDRLTNCYPVHAPLIQRLIRLIDLPLP